LFFSSGAFISLQKKMAPFPRPLSLHRVVMMVVLMSAITDHDAFRAGAMPAGLAFSRLEASSLAAAATLAARLAAGRIVLDLATRWHAPFRLRCWPAFEVPSARDGDTKATTANAATT
jgi:hypothetical protein